jgi:hypothetical protein
MVEVEIKRVSEFSKKIDLDNIEYTIELKKEETIFSICSYLIAMILGETEINVIDNPIEILNLFDTKNSGFLKRLFGKQKFSTFKRRVLGKHLFTLLFGLAFLEKKSNEFFEKMSKDEIDELFVKFKNYEF